MQSAYGRLRRRVWEIVDVAAEGDRMSRAVDTFILSLIFLNVLETVCTSVAWIQALAPRAFQLFELFSVMVFSVEYVARVWSSTSESRFAVQEIRIGQSGKQDGYMLCWKSPKASSDGILN
ncbi:hypothetical protein [Candidatus Entotheonella palauensis]|nr:hypothetical protein [Candidatus Entotheonella palauensis]